MNSYTSLSRTFLLFSGIASCSLLAMAQSAPPASSATAPSTAASSATATAPANATVPATANTNATAPVQVTAHGDQLDVKVPDQAPLSAVMSSVCQQQKLKCSGTETLTTYRGPAMSVQGTLRQVIAKLVEGTDVNYEFSRSAEGGATAIAFLGHAPKGTAPVPRAEQPAPPSPPRALHSRPFPGKIPEQGPPAPQQ